MLDRLVLVALFLALAPQLVACGEDPSDIPDGSAADLDTDTDTDTDTDSDTDSDSDTGSDPDGCEDPCAYMEGEDYYYFANNWWTVEEDCTELISHMWDMYPTPVDQCIVNFEAHDLETDVFIDDVPYVIDCCQDFGWSWVEIPSRVRMCPAVCEPLLSGEWILHPSVGDKSFWEPCPDC
jgi:hypothetical protein